MGDAVKWVEQLASTARISRVVIVGHSEGALIGTLAAQKSNAVALVAIAGAGVRASELIRVQLQKSELPRRLLKTVDQTIESLLAGRPVNKVDPRLMSLFRPSVQPYLMSWFHYDPVEELAALTKPVLIVQGTNDLQIDVTHALKLKRAASHVTLAWIADMNHVLKEAPASARRILRPTLTRACPWLMD